MQQFVYMLVLFVGWEHGAVTSTVIEFTTADACSEAVLVIERQIDDQPEKDWYTAQCLFKGK